MYLYSTIFRNFCLVSIKKINRCIHKYIGCTVLYMFIVRFHHRYLHSLRYHRYYPWFRYCPVYWYFLHFPAYQCFLRFLRNRCPHYVPVWNCYSDHRHCCRYCPAGYHFRSFRPLYYLSAGSRKSAGHPSGFLLSGFLLSGFIRASCRVLPLPASADF